MTTPRSENDASLGRVRWQMLRWALFGIAALVTLIVVFYTEENWRGRRAWERCQQELAAKGEKLDWAAFIPPTVPDEGNFYKAPGMMALFSKKAARTNPDVRFLSLPAWVKDRPATLEQLRAMPDKSREELRQGFAQQGPDYRLLEAACARPDARLDYDRPDPITLDIPNFVRARDVAQALATRTSLNLLEGKPDAAAHDLWLLRRVADATDDKLTLVGAMIRTAIMGLYVTTARDGLEAGLWSGPQLEAIQGQVRDLDLLDSLARSLRAGERAEAGVLSGSREELLKYFTQLETSKRGEWKYEWRRIKWDLCPRGWFLQNAASLSRAYQDQIESVDVPGRRISAARFNAAQAKIAATLRGRTSPYNFAFAPAMPNLSKAWQAVARNQTLLDQLYVASALERCRFASGSYPERLDALIPAYLDRIPGDLFADRPLTYRRNPDGNYELWSVGWNEQDDGGTCALDAKGKPIQDTDKGDWVWRGPVK